MDDIEFNALMKRAFGVDSVEEFDEKWDESLRTQGYVRPFADAIIYDPGTKRTRGNKPMKREHRRAKRKRVITYDLETTNIDVGTPDVLYLTAFAEAEGKKDAVRISAEIKGETPQEHRASLLFVLETYLFIEEHNHARFVAWNGNKFDAHLIALALIESDEWIIAPYLTRSRSVRGMRLEGRKSKQGLKFEILDGMAMTGLDTVGLPLKKFLKAYAPDFEKLTGPDFEHEQFSADNPQHVAYAERDSEGLWHAMKRANEIMTELTGNELATTMGRAAINYFQSQMPEGVAVWRPPEELFDILHQHVKRGGYVWINKQYTGPVWKYDINQAYAGAMRDCDLPAGTAVNCGEHYQEGVPGVYRCWISRREPSPIPFYYKDAEDGGAGFTSGRRVETWITSIEVEHLQSEDWAIEVTDGWYWPEKFRMTEMVDNLERLRFTDPDGPSGPIGTFVKTIGNSGYGKTLEVLEGVSFVIAKEAPPDTIALDDKRTDLPIWVECGEPHKAAYHQPQIGCFITAHVRIQLREAALVMPEHFIYGDTDCVMFSAPATHLKIDPRRYGDWKIEAEGVRYTVIAKKVYYGDDGTKHAKGMRIKELTPADFDAWKAGKPPTQKQLQRTNFLKLLQGAPMFGHLERQGTDVKRLKTVNFDGEKFTPLH